ncbi:YraN family protein [Candidatus Microgenomates bacterium]|nr:YraN family protein [Candidatus Microgenomates bacterium]
MSKYENKKIGDWGEEVAAKYLRARGYDIIKRNYRCYFGEIDIIARRGPNLVFVEVKTKTSNRFGLPEEMVDSVKIEKINNIINYVLGRWNGPEPIVRMDVISVIRDRYGGLYDIKHIENFDI